MDKRFDFVRDSSVYFALLIDSKGLTYIISLQVGRRSIPIGARPTGRPVRP